MIYSIEDMALHWTVERESERASDRRKTARGKHRKKMKLWDRQAGGRIVGIERNDNEFLGCFNTNICIMPYVDLSFFF